MNSGKLSLHNVSVNLGKTEVLQNISFSIEKGRTLTVVGPSGCGKSTLLNVLSGIIKHYEGEIYMGEAKLRDAGLTFGYVPQNLGLLPWKKVKDNILLPFRIDRTIEPISLTTKRRPTPTSCAGARFHLASRYFVDGRTIFGPRHTHCRYIT